MAKLRTDPAWANMVGVYREINAAKWALDKWPAAARMQLHSDSLPMVQALQKQDFTKWNKVYARKLASLPKDWIYIAGDQNPADKWSRQLYNANVCVDRFSKRAVLCGRRNKYRKK